MMTKYKQLETRLDWALWWAAKGFSVLPVHYVKPDGSCSCSLGKDCPSPGKHPAPSRWKHYQTQRADEDTLTIWFDGRFKDHNIGVVTGEISGNVFAVDVDVAEGKPGADTLDDLCMANDDLPQTLEQITGSGGRHYLFKAPEGKTIATGANTLGDGVDTRGEGGFIVVAPSNHKSGGSYVANAYDIEESPDWLVTMLEIDGTRPTASGPAMQNTGNTNMWGDVVDGREGYMVQLILGTIRTWWAQRGVLPTPEQLFDDAWPTYEMKVKARGRSLDDDGRGEALFKRKCWYQLKRAKNNELRILANVEPGSEKHLERTPLSATSVGEAKEARVAPASSASPLLITDWGMHRYSGEAPNQEWLIENILPARVPGLVAAIGGLGKSFILLDLCMKVAGGDQAMHSEQAFGGKVARNGKVVFFGAEDSAASMHRRIANISDQTLRDRAAANLFVVPMPDAGGPQPFIEQVMGQYNVTPVYSSLRDQLLAMGDVALIVIDPLQAFAAADINTDPAAAQFWWSLMSEMCVSVGANVLVSHHMRKDGSFSISKSMQAREAIRGTTALVDGARWVYGLWNMPEADEIVIAQKMGFEAGQGVSVCGGIVKVNDQADMSTATFIRSEGGLLENKTDEVATILEASAKLDKVQTQAIFTQIERRWTSEQPFAVGNNTARSFLAWIKSEYGMPPRAAKNYLNAWLDQGYLEIGTSDGHSKMKGLKVVRYPD